MQGKRQEFGQAWKNVRVGKWRVWTDMHTLARDCMCDRTVAVTPFLYRKIIYEGYAPHLCCVRAVEVILLAQRDQIRY